MALKPPRSQKNLKSDACDVFNNALDYEDCRGILLNFSKNLEKEV